jgi:hypothetical protein
LGFVLITRTGTSDPTDGKSMQQDKLSVTDGATVQDLAHKFVKVSPIQRDDWLKT